MHRCWEKEGLLSQQWENQQKNLGEMLHCLATLENREERELRITLQEDQIQQLQDKLVLQGKVCCCHECPGATEGPSLVGPLDPTDEEEEGLEYATN